MQYLLYVFYLSLTYYNLLAQPDFSVFCVSIPFSHGRGGRLVNIYWVKKEGIFTRFSLLL